MNLFLISCATGLETLVLEKGIFEISKSSGANHRVSLGNGNPDIKPSCTCQDWTKRHMLCQHFSVFLKTQARWQAKIWQKGRLKQCYARRQCLGLTTTVKWQKGSSWMVKHLFMKCSPTHLLFTCMPDWLTSVPIHVHIVSCTISSKAAGTILTNKYMYFSYNSIYIGRKGSWAGKDLMSSNHLDYR